MTTRLALPELARARTRNMRGFSLVQMVTVAAVVVILTAVALPVFLSASRPNRLRNDANAMANLVIMARMRASMEFAHTQVVCTTAPTSGPPYCQLQSWPYQGTAWNNDNQKVYLSAGVSFASPASSSVSTYPPNQNPTPYQGDSESTAGSPAIIFNSRGLPIDSGNNLKSDYALYLEDQTGAAIAIAVNTTGRPDVYAFGNDSVACPKPALPCFSVLREY